jgi:hypothetical protein
VGDLYRTGPFLGFKPGKRYKLQVLFKAESSVGFYYMGVGFAYS